MKSETAVDGANPIKYPPRRILLAAEPSEALLPYFLELIRGLGSKGVEVHWAVPGVSKQILRDADFTSLPNIHLESGTGRERETESWLMELEERLQPDIIHLND